MPDVQDSRGAGVIGVIRRRGERLLQTAGRCLEIRARLRDVFPGHEFPWVKGPAVLARALLDDVLRAWSLTRWWQLRRRRTLEFAALVAASGALARGDLSEAENRALRALANLPERGDEDNP